MRHVNGASNHAFRTLQCSDQLPSYANKILAYTFGQHSDLYQKPRSASNGGHALGP